MRADLATRSSELRILASYVAAGPDRRNLASARKIDLAPLAEDDDADESRPRGKVRPSTAGAIDVSQLRMFR